jgi:hypothetical protein
MSNFRGQNSGTQSSSNIISPARQAASRANGAKSGGPKAAGKIRSRRNAFKHGLRAGPLLLDEQVGGEHLRKVKAWLEEEYEPKTLRQSLAFERVVIAIVGYKRAHEVEFNTLIHGLAFESASADRVLRYISMADDRLAQAYVDLEDAFKEEEPFAVDDDDQVADFDGAPGDSSLSEGSLANSAASTAEPTTGADSDGS